MNYVPSLKSTRMLAVIAAIDANASPGSLELATSLGVVLATITLAKPSFTESGGVITMAGAPKSGTGVNTGEAAVARIKDGGGTVIVNNLSVDVSGADIIIDDTAITLGDIVIVSAGSITHSA